MYRTLFRIGVLTAAAVIGGTVLSAANASNAETQAPAATKVADSGPCMLIDGFWYCWDDFDEGQNSSTSDSSNS